MSPPTRVPTLFVSHGSPMTALEPREAGRFLQALGPRWRKAFGAPRAVLAISAHSLAREPVLLAAERHAAVYDFGGFDPALRTLRYDVAGAPTLAQRVQVLLHAAGLPAHTVPEGGLDHGIWTPLRFLLPEADVPVLPLAWSPTLSPQALMHLGQALTPLRDEGVMILASGSITHNLQRVFAQGLGRVDQPTTPQSQHFRDWFAQRSARADWSALADYRRQAPYAALMHPSDEHLLPFYVAAGAAQTEGPGLRLHASQTYGDLGMDAYAFGDAAPALISTSDRAVTVQV